jgi:hypothetical protein
VSIFSLRGQSLLELTITYAEDDALRERAQKLAFGLAAIRAGCSMARRWGAAAVSSIGPIYGRAVASVVAVLFTCDRRVFFEHHDDSIRVAMDRKCDEVLLEMLVWRDRFCVESDPLPECS